MRGESGSAGAGALYAVAAYGIWGVFPLYWRALEAFPAGELLALRVVFSCATGLALARLLGVGPALRAALVAPRQRYLLGLTALLIGGNWLVFLWAVLHDQVLATSLGYYVAPLVNVLLGVVVLRERLAPIQIAAVGLAALGILQLTLDLDELPWVTLLLAFSFAFYGLVRKLAPVEPVVGFALETLWLVPFGLVYLALLAARGETVVAHASASDRGLVVLSGLATAAPLIFFNAAARRLPLSTLGFFQYLAPTISFALAVAVFGEPFRRGQALAFGCVWLALALFSVHSLRASRADPTRTAALAGRQEGDPGESEPRRRTP